MCYLKMWDIVKISTVPECDWDALLLDTEQKLTPERGAARTCLHVCDECRLHKMTESD